MTEHLRDARLKKALDSAPDAAPVPAEWARLAIKNAALWPAPAAAPLPWWRRLWGGAGGGRTPWNAAFATVLVAGFVTVLWQGQEVPDAAPEPVAQTPSAAPAPASPPVAKAESPAAAAAPPVVADGRRTPDAPKARAAERERAADATRAREDRVALAERRTPAGPGASPAPEPAAPVFPKPAPVPPELAAVSPAPMAAPAAPAAVAPPPPPVVAAAPAPATADAARSPPAGFAAGGVARPAARAAARDSAVAESQAAPQQAAKAAAPEPVLLPPTVPADWASARIAIDGRAAVTLPRARSGALHQRLQGLLAGFNQGSAETGAAPAGKSARIELLNAAGERQALLTVDGGALRWIVVLPGGGGPGERATLGRADAAALEAVLAELDRLSAASAPR